MPEISHFMERTSGLAKGYASNSNEEVVLSQFQEKYGETLIVISRVIKGRLPEIQSSDFEDLKQTILIKIVQKLRESDEANENNLIKDFSGYIAGVAHNTCNDFLRAKSPARALLKQNLRDLFARHPELATWRDGQFTLCGFSEWTGRSLSVETGEKVNNIYELIEIGGRLSRTERDGSKKAPTAFIFNILNLIDGPILLEDLANLVAHFQGCTEYTFTSFEDDSLSTQHSTWETTLLCGADADDARVLLRRIWELLQERSLDQRRTFLYTFTDENGDSLLRRMFEDRVATISEITESLEISAEHLLVLVERTPFDAESAAAELNESKAKVNKWRHRVSEYLLSKLKEEKK